MLDEKNLLDFIYELNQSGKNYPKHLLHLFMKYFSAQKLLYFPYINYNPVISGAKFKKESLNQYIAFNIDLKYLTTYANYYYKHDIFAPMNIPKALNNQDVVSIEDLMSYDEYESTEYYNFLHSAGLYYQTCIHIRYKNQISASVSLFRNQDEGPFTRSQLNQFELLTRFISAQFAVAVESSTLSTMKKMLSSLQGGMPMGLVVLDNRLKTFYANNMARQFCHDILKNSDLGNSIFQRTVTGSDMANFAVQQIINHLGTDLLYSDHLMTLPVNTSQFSFYKDSFVSSDNMGNIDSCFLVAITKQELEVDEQISEILHSLSSKERNILELICNGMSNNQIADQTHLSVHTVKTYASRLYDKFEVKSRAELLSLYSHSRKK